MTHDVAVAPAWRCRNSPLGVAVAAVVAVVEIQAMPVWLVCAPPVCDDDDDGHESQRRRGKTDPKRVEVY